MAVYLMYKEYKSNQINEQDLTNFALELWKSGHLKAESRYNKEINDTVTKYSIKVYEEEND